MKIFNERNVYSLIFEKKCHPKKITLEMGLASDVQKYEITVQDVLQ